MAHRKAGVQVTNQTGVPLLSGAICHKYRDHYKIECAWRALQDGETTRVDYSSAKMGKDCWVITWMDATGGIYVTRSSEDMEGLRTLILKPDRVLFRSESWPSAGLLRATPTGV